MVTVKTIATIALIAHALFACSPNSVDPKGAGGTGGQGGSANPGNEGGLAGSTEPNGSGGLGGTGESGGKGGGAGACSQIDDELYDLIQANRNCTQDSDCRELKCECLYKGREGCNWIFHVNRNSPYEELKKKNQELIDCVRTKEPERKCSQCLIGDPFGCINGKCGIRL